MASKEKIIYLTDPEEMRRARIWSSMQPKCFKQVVLGILAGTDASHKAESLEYWRSIDGEWAMNCNGDISACSRCNVTRSLHPAHSES